jgi:hypothetical protein
MVAKLKSQVFSTGRKVGFHAKKRMISLGEPGTMGQRYCSARGAVH